jgi:hypothetical protein
MAGIRFGDFGAHYRDCAASAMSGDFDTNAVRQLFTPVTRHDHGRSAK